MITVRRRRARRFWGVIKFLALVWLGALGALLVIDLVWPDQWPAVTGDLSRSLSGQKDGR